MNSYSQCIGKNCSLPTLLFNNKKYTLSLSVHAFFLSLSLEHASLSLSLPFRHSQQLSLSLPTSPSHRIISACRHEDRCSHLHNRPMISPMILLSNMYQRPDTPPTGLNPSKSNNPSTPTSSMSEPTTSPPINHQRQTKTQSKHILSHRKTTTKKKIKKSPISPNAPSPGIPNAPLRLHLPASNSSLRRERRE
jgi:hypothetical protein